MRSPHATPYGMKSGFNRAAMQCAVRINSRQRNGVRAPSRPHWAAPAHRELKTGIARTQARGPCATLCLLSRPTRTLCPAATPACKGCEQAGERVGWRGKGKGKGKEG